MKQPAFNSTFKPRLYNSEEVRPILSVSMRRDKLGNMFHCVEWSQADGSKAYATFTHMSSVLDFIENNFK